MKHLQTICLTPLLLLSLVASYSASAAPLVSIGDNTDIFFNGYTGVQWSSNVFRDNDNEEDDVIWSLTPGFEVNFGRGVSNADLSIVTQYEIRRYAELSELDTELFNIKLNGAYETSRLDLRGSAYFREEKFAAGEVSIIGDLLEADKTGANVNGEYQFSPKFSFGAGLRYNETDYKTYEEVVSDRDRFDIPLNVYYELTPKVDLSAGYTYSESDIDGTTGTLFVAPIPEYSTEDHYINVGARGALLPKLTGSFDIGYRTRDYEDIERGSDDTIGLTADLTWVTTPKLTNRIGLSRDYGVSGDGYSSEDTSISLSTNYSLNSYYGASAFASYTVRDYVTDREDKQYSLGARLNYTPNEFWRFSLGYTFSENDSDDPNQIDSDIRSYTNHTVDFRASLRY